MVTTARDEIANVLTLKELWERVSALETNVKAMLKCDEVTKDILASMQKDSATLEAYKESSSIRHKSIEHRMDDLEPDIEKLEVTKAEVAAIRESTTLAKENVDMRLATMNEFRGQLKDQTATFVSRGELQPRFDRTDEDIRLLRESRAELIGKASQSSVIIAYLIAIVGIAISIIGMFAR
jgi:chromosome segregation ATPase